MKNELHTPDPISFDAEESRQIRSLLGEIRNCKDGIERAEMRNDFKRSDYLIEELRLANSMLGFRVANFLERKESR